MGASNIQSVSLSEGGLTITGEITDMKDQTVKLLHVWLAQPGCGEQKGAGLAIDCLADGDPFVGERFTVTAAPAGPQNKGVFGEFFDGPATVSAIAVLSTNEGVTQVLQWSRIVILPEYPVPLSASAASQAEPK